MAIVIGIIGMVVGITGIIIGWIALTKVQALSVAFVKSHIQGLRTETAKNSAAMNTIINKLAIMEKTKAKAESSSANTTAGDTPTSTH